eukprot:TRINITY_DN570_c0_g1_i1.p1 TRINITY_DN570_c0_g1~~TRINITY_DN570_c0_g1_i1.p1  ORF type:complete len:1270 (-),score=291.42 TRINITY_DN570_c0_g1_i1:3205-6672(-)
MKAKNILGYLNEKGRIDIVSFRNKIKKIQWLPIEFGDGKEDELKTPKSWRRTVNTPLLSVEGSRLKDKYHRLVCAVTPVLDISAVGVEVGENLKKLFDYDNPPSPDSVIEQLNKIVGLQTSPEDYPIISDICREIYKFLHNLLQRQKIKPEALNGLKEKPCIWVKNNFVLAQKVSLDDDDLTIEPHLYKLDNSVAQESLQFFKALGTAKEFKEGDYSKVLALIAAEYESKPLIEEKLNQVIKVVKFLVKKTYKKPEGRLKIHAPDTEGFLLLNSDQNNIIYDDGAEWMTIKPTIGNFKTLHREFSLVDAENLGIPKFSTAFGVQNSTPLGPELGEEFGQKERLTTRLKSILEQYPSGTGVMKELIQNADDAGATQCVFILDQNLYGQQSLIGQGLKDFQGPALLSYNDARFNDSDIIAIQHIAESNKSQVASKIGRFGVGFNSVYHLTDLPSFITGNALYCLDPHTTHVPSASHRNPGRKFHYTTEGMSSYIDQFAPYHIQDFGFDMAKEFKGTLFRFPLRTKAMKSDISNYCPTENEVKNLLIELGNESEKLLMFLKNLKHIKVQIKTADGKLQNLWSLTLDSANKDELKKTVKRRKALDDYLSQSGTSFISNMKTKLNKKKYEMLKTFIILKTKFESYSDNNSNNALNSNQSSSKTFYVASYLGGKNPMEMAVQNKEQTRLIPWAGVAVEVPDEFSTKHKEYIQKLEKSKGQVFCFLPLPIFLNSPLLINGYLYVTQDRQTIRSGTGLVGLDKVKLDWNQAIMTDTVSSCLVYFLKKMKKKISSMDLVAKDNLDSIHLFSQFYYKLLTQIGSSNPLMKELEKSLYQQIAHKKLLMLQDSLNWVKLVPSTKEQQQEEGEERQLANVQPLFCDFNSTPSDIIQIFRECLNLQLLSAPLDIQKIFQASQVEVSTLDPEYIINHLRKLKLPIRLALNNHPLKNEGNILKVWLFVNPKSTITHQILGLPLVLLQSGEVATLDNEQQYYFTDDSNVLELLHASHSQFIKQMWTPNSVNQFGQANVLLFSPNHLIDFMGSYLPHVWRGKNTVKSNNPDQPSSDWWKKFWKYIKKNRSVDLKTDQWGTWPILLTEEEDRLTISKAKEICYSSNRASDATTIIPILKLCGLTILSDKEPVPFFYSNRVTSCKSNRNSEAYGQ